jgi:elongator complex protein 5
MSLIDACFVDSADVDRNDRFLLYHELTSGLAAFAPEPEWWENPEDEKRIAEEIYLTGSYEDRVAPRVRIRARDCKQWIKYDNRNFTGHRKRRPELPLPRVMNKPLSLASYQRHSVHLMGRVLNVRTNASPFTLVLDDLNQRADMFISEITRRALSRNVNVVFVTFESSQAMAPIRTVQGFGITGDEILKALRKAMDDAKESLVVIDNLHELLYNTEIDMTTLFKLVVNKYASTLVGVYHQDLLDAQPESPYAPQPLELVKYMATSIITCQSFAHCLAAKAARERSLPEPTWGLLEMADGVVQCLDANDERGIVLEAEFRRKSGKPEGETYFLRTPLASDYHNPMPGIPNGTLKTEYVILLEQHYAYAANVVGVLQDDAENINSTFNLGLTEKQKEARDGVVLPYFDAQKGEGAGEGGRILYDMGSEDDFDEEEDEI